MQIEQRPIADLKPHPSNYRRHPEAQLAVLRQSIRLHGLQKPVVIQSDNTPKYCDVVLARWEALTSEKAERVHV